MQMNFNAIRLLRMVVLLTLTIFGFDHVNAQNFDQEYLNWKAKQQAQDARLGSRCRRRNQYVD